MQTTGEVPIRAKQALFILALGVALVAVPSASGRHTPTHPQDCKAKLGGKTWKPLIDRAYALRKWRKEDPRSDLQRERIKRHRRCARTPDTRAWMVDSARRHRHRFKEHRKAKLAAVESWCAKNPHPDGGGCWVIPAWCVEAESGGSWSAYNPSGALGPYQLLGHGAPFPVSSRDQAMAHHRIARGLYAAGGLGPWVAC